MEWFKTSEKMPVTERQENELNSFYTSVWVVGWWKSTEDDSSHLSPIMICSYEYGIDEDGIKWEQWLSDSFDIVTTPDMWAYVKLPKETE